LLLLLQPCPHNLQLLTNLRFSFPLTTAIRVAYFLPPAERNNKKTANVQHTFSSSSHPTQHFSMYPDGEKSRLPHPNNNRKTAKPKNQPPPQPIRGMGKLLCIPSPRRTKDWKQESRVLLPHRRDLFSYVMEAWASGYVLAVLQGFNIAESVVDNQFFTIQLPLKQKVPVNTVISNKP